MRLSPFLVNTECYDFPSYMISKLSVLVSHPASTTNASTHQQNVSPRFASIRHVRSRVHPRIDVASSIHACSPLAVTSCLLYRSPHSTGSVKINGTALIVWAVNRSLSLINAAVGPYVYKIHMYCLPLYLAPPYFGLLVVLFYYY